MPEPSIRQLSAKSDAIAIAMINLINEMISAGVITADLVRRAERQAAQTAKAVQGDSRTDVQVPAARRAEEVMNLFRCMG